MTMSVRAEILATGDEVRSGTIVDSNTAHIARRLEETGIAVARHHCAGDDVAEIADVLREMGRRCRIAVVTGGLGPTGDDLTAAAAARAAAVALEENPDALRQVAAWFTSRGRTLSAANRKQALMPVGARVIPNPRGTAPGFEIAVGQAAFFFLPGVPSEMRPMLDETVLPRIIEHVGGRRQVHRLVTLATFGLPESVAAERTRGFAEAFPGIKLGFQIRFPEVWVKCYAAGGDAAVLDRELGAAAAWLRERLGDHVFTEDGRCMAEVVGDLLRRRRVSLAVAESCTGGLIAHWLTEVAGSSDYFLFSAVTYSNAAKKEILGVPPGTLDTCGAVHADTARAMARGAARVSGADYAIATSGIAGPAGGSPAKPVGTLCVGLATPDGDSGRRFHYSYGRRAANKQAFAMTALDTLRRKLLNINKTSR